MRAKVPRLNDLTFRRLNAILKVKPFNPTLRLYLAVGHNL